MARRGLLDRLLRERSGRHLQLALERDVLRRGESVTVRLTFADAARVRKNVEVGLVCTERYAERQQRQSSSGGMTTTRVMLSATAYERWEPSQPSQPLQRFTFEVPQDAPYSYEGEHLEFHWRVSAREPLALRPDPSANVDLTVRP